MYKCSKCNSDRKKLSIRCKVCTKLYHENYWKNPINRSRRRKNARNTKFKKEKRMSDKKYNESPQAKDRHLKKYYKIDLLQYHQMVIDQNGCCAICNIPQSKLNRTLDVDHCHKTGKVRGLLCTNCNRALGMFQDSASICIKASEYLKHGRKVKLYNF